MENQVKKRVSVANFLAAPSTSKFLQETLSEKKQEFVSNLIALTDSDSNLAECDPAQLMKCAMNATALNLPLNKNLGYAYVIAYKQNGIPVPQFQIGYKGMIQLAIRTGQYKFINATEIREGEITSNKITGEVIFHGEKPNSPIVGYMAYLEMTNGFTASLYMSNEKMEEHAMRFSKTYQNDKKYNKTTSKWSDPLARPAMCKKTVLKGLLGTYGLMTTEFAKALDSDSDEEQVPGSQKYEDAEVVSQTDPDEIPEQAEPSGPVKVKL
jgi:recombination protein RecT